MTNVFFALLLANIGLSVLNYTNHRKAVLKGFEYKEGLNYRFKNVSEDIVDLYNYKQYAEEEEYVLRAKIANTQYILSNLIAVQKDCEYVANYLGYIERPVVDIDEVNPMNIRLHCHIYREDGTELIITPENLRESVKNYKADLAFEVKERARKKRNE